MQRSVARTSRGPYPGDVNGYMLLVDGDDAGQIVYRTTVNRPRAGIQV